MLDQIIAYSFYLLFFFTPLFWSSSNYELFEYNKMILAYGITVIITGAWILKMIQQKSLILKTTPLDIPLLLFLAANILSTIFSIDPHTSIWGYYSRSNGGLLSLIVYLLLYWAFVSNMDFKKIKVALQFTLASGFFISIWAILEHFGVSFSCVILRGEFNVDCWVQRVQERVFATLGQPNWLAAYLAMLIFPALYFLITASRRIERITYYVSLIIMYLAFTFTYSRGPSLGLIAGLTIFLIFYFLHLFNKNSLTLDYNKPLLLTLASFIIINILFGSALTSFRLVSKFAAPTRPSISLPVSTGGTQLENGGTESGQIRFIVWQGAWDVFKHYPIFGSGVETFAYSYYQYRPASHNLTSEWDFLYNKAHNEYLNYLATTGIVGITTYLLVIGIFIFWCIKQIINKKHDSKLITFLSAILAAYISYLIYNFFLFSVVVIAIFFFLFPAISFIVSGSIKNLVLPKVFPFNSSFLTLIYRRPAYIKITQGLVIFFIVYLLYSLMQLWYADTLFAKGQRASENGNPGRAYNYLSAASELNKGEPFYRSELAFAAAQAAAALKETDATLSAELKDEAKQQTEYVLKNSPKNVSFLRTAIRTYFELSTIDPIYLDKTLQAIDNAIQLAPTDPKLYYNKALILHMVGRKDEEVATLQQALTLKPNYLDVIDQLKEATASTKP